MDLYFQRTLLNNAEFDNTMHTASFFRSLFYCCHENRIPILSTIDNKFLYGFQVWFHWPFRSDAPWAALKIPAKLHITLGSCIYNWWFRSDSAIKLICGTPHFVPYPIEEPSKLWWHAIKCVNSRPDTGKFKVVLPHLYLFLINLIYFCPDILYILMAFYFSFPCLLPSIWYWLNIDSIFSVSHIFYHHKCSETVAMKISVPTVVMVTQLCLAFVWNNHLLVIDPHHLGKTACGSTLS